MRCCDFEKRLHKKTKTVNVNEEATPKIVLFVKLLFLLIIVTRIFGVSRMSNSNLTLLIVEYINTYICVIIIIIINRRVMGSFVGRTGASVVTNISSFRRKSNGNKTGRQISYAENRRVRDGIETRTVPDFHASHTVGTRYSETSKPNYVRDHLLLFSVRTTAKQLYCNIYAGRSARARVYCCLVLFFVFVNVTYDTFRGRTTVENPNGQPVRQGRRGQSGTFGRIRIV